MRAVVQAAGGLGRRPRGAACDTYVRAPLCSPTRPRAHPRAPVILQLSAAGDAELAHIRAIVAPSFSKKIMSVDDAGDKCVSSGPWRGGGCGGGERVQSRARGWRGSMLCERGGECLRGVRCVAVCSHCPPPWRRAHATRSHGSAWGRRRHAAPPRAQARPARGGGSLPGLRVVHRCVCPRVSPGRLTARLTMH
eukprot:Tamp_23259.p2 GENE.Tamp_23259~~Tamp_23259.p2  ORF type:complete len:194 (+),score=12.42 Tamp_23259:157-738(+)